MENKKIMFQGLDIGLNPIERYSVEDGINAEDKIFMDVINEKREYGLIIWQPKNNSLVCPMTYKRRYLSGLISQKLQVMDIFPVFRRSGGGVVPFFEGVFSIAFAFPSTYQKTMSIYESYLNYFDPVVKWLKQFNVECSMQNVPGSFCDGKFNISVDSRKIAGTAQRWSKSINGKKVIFGHAVFLLNSNLRELTESVNNFYEICKIDEICLEHSHINFFDCLGGSSFSSNFGDKVVSLYDLYIKFIRNHLNLYCGPRELIGL